MEYAEFRAAERAQIPFPGIGRRIWEELNPWEQTVLIAYDQIRSIEDAKLQANL